MLSLSFSLSLTSTRESTVESRDRSFSDKHCYSYFFENKIVSTRDGERGDTRIKLDMVVQQACKRVITSSRRSTKKKGGKKRKERR